MIAGSFGDGLGTVARLSKAFTIVELLIVVVVIAILASITVVAYNGVVDKAESARVMSGFTSVSKQVKVYESLNGELPGESNSLTCPSPIGGYFSVCRFVSVRAKNAGSVDEVFLEEGGHKQRNVIVSPSSLKRDYEIDLPNSFGYYAVSFSAKKPLVFIAAEFRSARAIPEGMKISKRTDRVFPLSGAVEVSQTQAQKSVARVSHPYKIECVDGSSPALNTGDGVWSTYESSSSGAGDTFFLDPVMNGDGIRYDFQNRYIRVNSAFKRATAAFSCSGVTGGTIVSYLDTLGGFRGAMILSRPE